LKWSVQNRRAIPVQVAVDLLCQAAHGLHDAHEAATPLGDPLHIVHRDVSPQNVLVGVDGRVRLTDFGVARAVQRMTETVAGRVKGKFAYMAPEQLTAKEIDRRADLFSLGVVAWEFFTGQRLFVGEHPAETMDRVRNMPILSISEVRPDVPRPVADIVAWALERDPDARCPTAREFEQNLRRAATQSGISFDKDEVVDFVKGSGGDALHKIRDNIKLALTARPHAGVAAQLDQHVELGLTPSGVKSAVQSVPPDPSHDTEPESDAGRPVADMDASAPSAAAHPGDVITQLRLDSLGGAPEPIAPNKPSKAPLLIGGVLVILLGFGIGALSMGGDDEVTTSIAEPAPLPPPVETAANTENDEGDGDQDVAQDVARDNDSVAAATAERAAQEAQEAAQQAAEQAVATDVRRRRALRRRGMATTASASAVTEAPAVTATTMAEPRMTTMSSGLVGLDAFDQGLMQ
jgi:serine/threonine-protein kinase